MSSAVPTLGRGTSGPDPDGYPQARRQRPGPDGGYPPARTQGSAAGHPGRGTSTRPPGTGIRRQGPVPGRQGRVSSRQGPVPGRQGRVPGRQGRVPGAGRRLRHPGDHGPPGDYGPPAAQGRGQRRGRGRPPGPSWRRRPGARRGRGRSRRRRGLRLLERLGNWGDRRGRDDRDGAREPGGWGSATRPMTGRPGPNAAAAAAGLSCSRYSGYSRSSCRWPSAGSSPTGRSPRTSSLPTTPMPAPVM